MAKLDPKFENHIIKVDGTHEPYPHKLKGKAGELQHAQLAVGGLIQFVELDDGTELVVNEEGLLTGLQQNDEATRLFHKAYGVGVGIIVGNVIRMKSKDIA